jgi:predicted ester cyclase
MKNALFTACILLVSTQLLAQNPADIAARNKATALKVNTAYNERRFDDGVLFYAPNYEKKSDKQAPGRAGVKANWESSCKLWPDNKIIFEQATAEGDWVIAKCKAQATHVNAVMGVEPTNKKMEAAFWEAWHFDKDGLIAESWTTLDNFAMMQQLGLLNKPTPSVMNEDEAIKQVIVDQTTAWANRDTTAYYACYANNDLMQSNYNNRDLSIGIYLGYAELQKYVRNGMKANPNKVYQPAVERTNWVIKLLSPEWAWVNFSQKTTTVRGIINTSYETRLMHKEDGKWRITVVNALWDYKNVVYPTPNPEEEDIKAVIINETEMFLDQKHDAWAESFIHEPHMMWSVTNGGEPGDVLTMRGWDALDTYMAKWFSNDMSALTKQWRKAKTTRDQWQIQIRSNVAYVSFNQRGDGEKQKMDSTETRVLEKINGKWKIAMATTLADFKDATPPIKSKY